MPIDNNIQFSQLLLRGVREEARKARIKLPKRLTALRSGVGNFWLVEADGFRKEVNASNAYEAKVRAIESILDNKKKV